MPLKNEGAEHPPDEEESNEGEQDMGEPLPGGLGSAESKHPLIVAGAVTAEKGREE